MKPPISIEIFNQGYESLSLHEFYSKELEKLREFSIKKNYDDYTFHCNEMKIIATGGGDPYSLLIKEHLDPKKLELFDLYNQKLWLLGSDPYNTSFALNGKISIYCNFSFLDKKIIINGIKNCVFSLIKNVSIQYSELNNKTIKNFNEKIEEIKKLAIKFIKEPNSHFEIENILMFKIFSPAEYLSLESEECSRSERLKNYFETRGLL